PGIFLFKSSLDGDYVMTKRNRNVVAGNSLEVDFETVDEWAILEDIAYSVDFSDFRRMKFAVLYIPIVSWVLLLMGFGARFNRRQLFYILLGGILFVIGIPQDFPLHKFLYDHFYVFRLFRNLHFFLWWAVLPCFILLLVEQLKVLGKEMERGKFSVVKICFITAVHAAALAGVLYWYKGVTCTVLSLGLSYVFFMAYFSGRLKGRSLRVIGLCVLAVVGIQPLEVYHYLSRNCAPRDFTYGYENNLLQPLYLNFWDPTGDQTAHYEFYIASTRVQKLADRVPVGVLSDYIKPWFIAYDEVSPCPETEGDWGAFNRALAVGQNRACVDDWPAQNILTRKGGKAVQILGPGQGLDILAYEPNSLKIAVVFDEPKLLVWNDAYHPGWSAFLDGSRIPIYRSNVAFKGIYVPAGRHVVRFQYRTILQYLLRVFTWMVYLAVFIGLIVAIFRKEERA
ncbi:MAG TPA: YfhO family protein, partial [Candidatus Bathyarchaeia archaeon]|nr:YfhO family protein [Candidatus Bathyarchaeia archaeon]